MKFFKSSIRNLNITDLSTIFFFIFLSILNLIFYSKIESWIILIIINIGVITFVFTLAYLDKQKEKNIWKYLHYFYVVPLILFIFKEIYLMLKPIRPNDFDRVLISIDRFIFDFNPTQILYKIANPPLTELLQIVYGTFYFLPIILGINLMMKNKWIELDYSVFCVVYGFFLSYIGYFLVPAVGPRFTLHNFFKLDNELPGLFVTGFLREMTNLGESIPNGTMNPAGLVQRDVFPSGHTQMTLIIMYLSAKLKVKTRYFLIPNGILLIFATVYLRYHYVVDLIGGFLFMIFTMWSAKFIFNWWQRYTNRQEFFLK
jgi:membrane-associated phospholipid phosphatase